MPMLRPAGGANFPLEVRATPSHESCRMDDTTRYEIIGEGQYRVLAQGWWADVQYRLGNQFHGSVF